MLAVRLRSRHGSRWPSTISRIWAITKRISGEISKPPRRGTTTLDQAQQQARSGARAPAPSAIAG